MQKTGKNPKTELPREIIVDQHDLIEKTAYSLAAQRGFAPGHELDDWRAAEIIHSQNPMSLDR